MNIRQAKKIHRKSGLDNRRTKEETEVNAIGKLLSVSVRKLGRLRGFWFFFGSGTTGVSGLRWKR